jgi:hypothetical protein
VSSWHEHNAPFLGTSKTASTKPTKSRREKLSWTRGPDLHDFCYKRHNLGMLSFVLPSLSGLEGAAQSRHVYTPVSWLFAFAKTPCVIFILSRTSNIRERIFCPALT